MPAPDYLEDLDAAAEQMYGAGLNYHDAIERFRSRLIIAAIKFHCGHKGKAAKHLGIHRNTVSREGVLCGIQRKRKA